MAYQSNHVDEMLESSFVRFLMDFDDPKTKEKMLKKLAKHKSFWQKKREIF